MRLFLAAAVISLTFAAAPAAQAHAHLKSADPASGAVITAAPSTLTLSFTEDVQPKFCTVTVTDSMGMRADTGAPEAVPGHADELSVPVKFQMPGKYVVVWHALSVDTHKTQGTYSFTIGN